jgi:Sec-independent protein translocase protein TatA
VLLLIVWIAVVVLALVVLGGIAYGVLGAVARLRKEVAGAADDLAPVLADIQATMAAAERSRQERSQLR